MEFLENHSVITKIEFDKIKLLVIDSFQSFYYEEREFRYVIDNTGRLINEKFSVTSELKKFITIESYDIYQKYINAFSNYSNKMIYNEKCKSVLKNEIYEYYNSLNEKDNPLKINFEDFVTYLLKYVAGRELIIRLEKNAELYKLYYENNYFENIIVDDIEGDVLHSRFYTDLFKKFNNGKNPSQIIEKNNDQVKKTNNSDKNELELLNEDEKTNSINLNDKEIALIMYFQTEVLKNNLKIPSTEMYKTYSLINVRPYDSFANDHSFKSTFQYKIITGVYGQVNFKNLNNVPKIEIEATIADINELQKKIKPLNLININKEINLFSNKLQAVLSK
jgi:hypothetical protein